MEANSYALVTVFKSNLQLAKNMTVSAKAYIPQEMLANDGSKINILPLLNCQCPNCDDGFDVWGKYAVVITKSADQQPVINMYEGNTVLTPEEVAKFATISAAGNYYVLKLTKYPLDAKKHAENPEDAVDVPTKGKYTTTFIFSFSSWGSPYDGPMYLDNVNLFAKKTTKVTYNKKDYKKISGFHWISGTPINVTTSKIK